ncbi:MYND-like zinc finger [Trypanosoma melophagium]|uniref:MYND-like zinc finger n=1 Tax=Trypanosoma melophagium TaxID=715481 RepID=UPI00351A7975|nr:MYND-like zinc finger [Trypanosoma melophagium]
MSPEQHMCDGCGNPASSFQCPLCQAEAITSRGFFCGQECFAKNWLNHRGTFHKSGVVRVKEQAQSTVIEESTSRRKRAAGEEKSIDTDKTKKRKLKKRDIENRELKEEEVNDKVKKSVVSPWSVLPRISDNIATVKPSLPIGIARAVIGGSSLDRHVAFWSAAVAAAHHIAAELEHQNNNKSSLQVLVITSGPLEASAIAWALRCAGLAGVMRLVLSIEAEDSAWNPSSHFSGNGKVVITTESIVRCVSNGSASAWLKEEESLLVTLPGVTDAADFQSVHTRAIFFVYRGTSINMTDDSWCVEEEIHHHVVPLQEVPAELHDLFNSAILVPTSASIDNGNDANLAHSSSLPSVNNLRFDNEVSTFLARGDIPSALQHLVRLYSSRRGVFEEILLNSLLSTLGAASVAHAHHILAYIVRSLVDHSSRFKGPQGGTLKEMALRAVSRVVRLLPPITASDEDEPQEEEKHETKAKDRRGKVVVISSGSSGNSALVPLPSVMEKHRLFNYYEKLPNLQLQATMCYLYPHTSPGIMDIFGTAWGVKKIISGPEALKNADQKRKDVVQRLRNRYGTKLDPAFANYLVVLMHFLYDTVASYSLSVEEVDQRTLWSITLAGEVGPLEIFLSNCFLLSKDDTSLTSEGVENKKKQITTLSGRQMPQKPVSRTVLLRSQSVRTAAIEEPIQLSWVDLPLTGKREREVERLQRQAVDEILMAMPRVPRPMYIGDVGNLIGKWFRFNARFDGALGVGLMEFLMQHPEAFRVAGNLVTRRTAGVADQVKMRFDDDSDNDNDGDDSDGDRKAKDRALLIGAGRKSGGRPGKDLPARARKKAMVKEFNKSRYNRNYKPIDPSAKVPGYVKHAPRKVKGRGRKVNLRNSKRG